MFEFEFDKLYSNSINKTLPEQFHEIGENYHIVII